MGTSSQDAMDSLPPQHVIRSSSWRMLAAWAAMGTRSLHGLPPQCRRLGCNGHTVVAWFSSTVQGLRLPWVCWHCVDLCRSAGAGTVRGRLSSCGPLLQWRRLDGYEYSGIVWTSAGTAGSSTAMGLLSSCVYPCRSGCSGLLWACFSHMGRLCSAYAWGAVDMLSSHGVLSQLRFFHCHGSVVVVRASAAMQSLELLWECCCHVDFCCSAVAWMATSFVSPHGLCRRRRFSNCPGTLLVVWTPAAAQWIIMGML